MISEKKKKEKNDSLSNLRYMMKLLWRGDKLLVFYSFYKQIAEQAFYVIFFVYFNQYIYTCIEEHGPFNELLTFVLILCGMHIVVHLVSAGHAYCVKRRQPLIYRSIFEKVIAKALKMDYVSFEQPDFYDKYTRALSESVDRGFQMMNSLVYFCASVISAALAMLVVIQVDPFLLVFVVPSVAASFFFGAKSGKAYYELDRESTRDKRTADYTKRVFYEKKYAGEIRLYSIKNVLFKEHRKAYANIYDINRKFRNKIALYNILRWVIFVLMSISLPLIYVAYVVKNNPGIPIAPYIAMVSALEFVSGNISDSIDYGIETIKHTAFVKNLRQFLEAETAVESRSAGEKCESLGDIEINNMTFTYLNDTTPTLKNISLKIRRGERVAFVGHNGAGKTTLVKLLMGLYETGAGEIKISGRDIADYERTSFHDHFGTVFQDLQIFALPLSQNVLMREPKNDEERQLVETALEKAQFGEKLRKLKAEAKGIDTMVTREFDDNGVVLSGGEAQKIAIARVFAKNPDIVILDEPSSALDPIAEYNMYNNMMQLAEDKTVIFISHRLSSARIADRIYVLDNGEIVESGTHDSLMTLDGKYAEMFNLQAKNYQDSLPEEMEVHLYGKKA